MSGNPSPSFQGIENSLSNEPDPLTAQSLDHSKAQTDALKAKTHLSSKYARKIMRYLRAYSIATACILLLAGFKKWTGFSLPPSVLTTLVGSTAVAAIGLVGLVIKGLFK